MSLGQGHVPDMSLGQGHVKKSQGQNQMASHIFDRIFSVTCPSHVLRVSHLSNTLKKQRKRKRKIIKSSKFLFGQLIWFHSKKILLKFFLCNYKLIIDSKIEKNGGVNKRFASRTQKMCRKAHFIFLPLVPPWSQIKFIFFIFSFFIKICHHNFNLGWTPQPALLVTKSLNQKNGWQCPPLDSFIHRSTQGQTASAKKVARSVGLLTNSNVNTTKLSNNNKKQNHCWAHQLLQRHQLAHLKVSFFWF